MFKLIHVPKYNGNTCVSTCMQLTSQTVQNTTTHKRNRAGRYTDAHNLTTAAHCSTLQHTAAHCSTLQHTATHGNPQHIATHCNTLQHTTKNTPVRTLSQHLTPHVLSHCLYMHICIYTYIYTCIYA